MARKPNYNFERKERERIKAEKATERAKLKAAKAEQAASETSGHAEQTAPPDTSDS